MGNESSRPRPQKMILIPPTFDRRHSLRNRFTESPFDYLFCKRDLRNLFERHMVDGLRIQMALQPEIPIQASLTRRTRCTL